MFPPGLLSPQDLNDIQKSIEEQQKKEAEKKRKEEEEAQAQDEEQNNDGNNEAGGGEANNEGGGEGGPQQEVNNNQNTAQNLGNYVSLSQELKGFSRKIFELEYIRREIYRKLG